MQRLVYAPKAYAWVQVEGVSKPFNISKYITSGRVSRKVNAVSEAQLTLRNPGMIFTKGSKFGKPFFKPMDPITIWLQRLAGHPVQVFTGYLDSTPYLQLYPGTCDITASCTLKRLQYTFWDPALPYTREFMASYGWISDLSNGILKQRNVFGPDLLNRKGDPVLDDGSIGNLLFGTLKNIGDWKPENIHIEKLPPGLVRRLADSYYAFAEDAKEVKEAYESFLKNYIGTNNYGKGGTGAGDSNPNSINYGDAAVPRTVYCVGKSMGVGPKPLLAAMMTGLVEQPGGGSFLNEARGDQTSVGWRQELGPPGVGPPDVAGRMDIKASSKRFFTECKQFDRPGIDAATLAGLVQRPNAAYLSRYAEVREAAENLVAILEKKGCGDPASDGAYASSLGVNGDPANVSIRPASVRTTSASPSTKNPIKDLPRNSKNPGRGGFIESATATKELPANTQSLAEQLFELGYWCTSANDGSHTGGSNHYKGLALDWGSVKNDLDSLYRIFEPLKKNFLELFAPQGAFHNGVAGANPETDPSSHIHSAIKPDVTVDIGSGGSPSEGASDTTTGATAGSSGDASVQDMMAISKATAFVNEMQFPGINEAIEALALRGSKSLMNDKPLLEFIQQLSGAALRDFQSLPNGDFFAFYPDYFGTEQHRAPYWLVSDIEITQGKIQLNDAALCTHMFVVGDTVPGGGIDFFEKSVSTGVITLANFGQSGFISHDPKADTENREVQVGKFRAEPGRITEFLTKYGVRPHLEPAPEIRSPFFESFLAYQKFLRAWANQFVTDFQFTFMPEIFPGGIIGFPEHGLQCYVDEVTHTFNYEGGFTTTATLSAPASLNNNLDDDPIQYGLVRAGQNPGN